MTKVISMEEAAAKVPDGARIAFGGGGAMHRRPMAFARALARSGVRELNVFHFLAGLETDLLIGAGAVASTNCVYVGLLEHGHAPNFQRAVRGQRVDVTEYSEYLYSAAMRAADLGIPFIPWKTPWRSDLVEHLQYSNVVDPYSGTELLAVPAMEIDVAVIQVDRADEDGYVEYPAEPDLVWDYDWLIARVAKTTIVCAEQVLPPRDPARVAVIGREVSWVVNAPDGAWPAGMHGRYQPDLDHVLGAYVPAAAAGDEEFAAYLEEHPMRPGERT